MNYWLMKSEPSVYGIDDLAAAPRKTEHWDGVRNYQARNMMRDQMQRGDLAFFYHSSCPTPGIAGIMRISRAGYPDHTAFDAQDPHFDPNSDPTAPRWFMVDVTLLRKLKRLITLQELREYAATDLSDLALLRRGNRLSVMPVSDHQWHFILGLE